MIRARDRSRAASRPAVGLNRWDRRSVAHFAAGVRRAEELGIDVAFHPVNPLTAYDPYVLLSAAAAATSGIGLGPLLETPALRPPAIAAGSIATLDEVSDGRALLVYGVGDTAVRLLGRRPSRVDELEAATREARQLLAGSPIDTGAGRPVRLAHARPVPVWVAAGGPRALRAAGRVADGVFLRVGTHPANVAAAVRHVREGMAEAGRSDAEVSIGLVVHTCRSDDPGVVRAVTRSMAAGFYEYSPVLFDAPGFRWDGPPIDELRSQVWPDFHHARDLVAAGEVVSFLSDEIAHSFSLAGTAADIADQLAAVRAIVPEVSIVVPHPVPNPRTDELDGYMRWLGEELIPRL